MATEAARMLLPVTRLTPYLRVRITTDDVAMRVEDRRSALLFVPLWRRRVELPLAELRSGRVGSTVRLDCLAAGVAAAALIVLLDLPIAAGVALGVVGLLMLGMAFTRTLRIEGGDGRSWSFPFCRDYAFDAMLAIEDAEQRRDALGVPALDARQRSRRAT
jgi:hypothetical protein